ncbi:MAG: BatD family protein [Candidatus Omnitrophota bacterium]|nr:BatD family protein [Candidatus Omnitrophota bacterium]
MKYIVSFLLLLSLGAICYADDISISADVDKRELTLDDQVTLTVTVSGSVSNIPQPEIPEIKGFTAYSSGRSQNLSIINGQVSSSVTFTYILVPNNTGEYTIGPFSINYKGNTYSADAVNIKVLPRTSQPQAPVQQQSQPYEPDTQNAQPQRGKEIFIETYVDKLRAYVNEQITLTFALYQAVNLFDNPVYNAPSATGFWTEDMPPQKKYYKVVNGVKYLVTEIKTALFATGPGEFTIGPARLEATLEDMDRFFSQNTFDVFSQDPFSMFKRGKPIILATDPIKAEIIPLPEQNKPLDFKGDVGSFDISANIDKNTAEENQPVSLKIQIKGKGNIKTISPPSMPDIEGVKLYESGSSENISKENYVVQGEKIFEKMIIPKKPGSFTIGPIGYSYFDPGLKDYVKKTVNPETVEVLKSKEDASEKPVSTRDENLYKEEVRLLKNDIAYIKTSSVKLARRNNLLYRDKIFLLINTLPLLALGLLYLYDTHRRRLETDSGYARSLRARGSASRRLRSAKAMISKNMVKEFYTEIHKAVIEYVADKLNIPHPSITKDLLEEKLRGRGIEEDVILKVKALFDECDMARFASAGFTKEDMLKTLNEAEYIIAGLQRRI